MALLLTRDSRWAPLVAFGIFVGELLTDQGPPPWRVLALTSLYLAAVYTLAAWALRRRGLERPISTPRGAAWFAGVIAAASGVAAIGYVVILTSVGQLSPDDAWGSIGRYWIGEFNGIIALTPVLLLRVERAALWEQIRRNRRELILQALGAVVGVAVVFVLVAARDVRLFYPLFAPVTWIALRHGVPGAMISVSLVQAALVAALELTPGLIALFDVQQAAIGSSQVATSIADVNRGAGDTGSASSQVLSSAQLLSSENTRLKAEVAKFLATVRAA